MSDFDLTRLPPSLPWADAGNTDSAHAPDAADAARAGEAPYESPLMALAGPPLQAGKALLEAAQHYVVSTPPRQIAFDAGRITLRGFLLMLATIPSDTPQEERDRWAMPAPHDDKPLTGTELPAVPVASPKLDDRPRSMWLQRLGEEGTGFVVGQHPSAVDPLRAVAQADDGSAGTKQPSKASRNTTKGDEATSAAKEAEATQLGKGRDEAKVRRMLDSIEPFEADEHPSTAGVARKIFDAAISAGMDAHDGMPYVDELQSALGVARGRAFSAVTLLREKGALDLYRTSNGLMFAQAPQPSDFDKVMGTRPLVPTGELGAGAFNEVDKSRAHRRGDMQALTTLALLQAAHQQGATVHQLMPPLDELQPRLQVSQATLRAAMKQAGEHGLQIESRPIVASDGQVRPRFVITAIDPPERLKAAIAALDESLPAAKESAPGDYTALATPKSRLREFKAVPRWVDGESNAYGRRIAVSLFTGLVRAGYKKDEAAPTTGELSAQMKVRQAQIRPAFELLEPFGVKVSAYFLKGATATNYRLVIDEMPAGDAQNLIRDVSQRVLNPPKKAASPDALSHLEPLSFRDEALRGRTASFAARNLYRWLVEVQAKPGWEFPSVTAMSKQAETSAENIREGLAKLAAIGVQTRHTRNNDGPVRELVSMPPNPSAAAAELNRRERFRGSERLEFDRPMRQR